jgi:hypothetical protein
MSALFAKCVHLTDRGQDHSGDGETQWKSTVDGRVGGS